MADELPYISCPRCGLVLRHDVGKNGSPTCPDCRRKGEVVMLERVVEAGPPKPPTERTG